MEKVFLYSKTDAAPVWLDSKNYSRTFYLATLSKEIIVWEKNQGKTNTKTFKKFTNLKVH